MVTVFGIGAIYVVCIGAIEVLLFKKCVCYQLKEFYYLEVNYRIVFFSSGNLNPVTCTHFLFLLFFSTFHNV